MPLLVRLVAEDLPVGRRNDRPVRADVGQHDELAAGAERADFRGLQLSEAFTEGDLLGVVDLLVAEDQHRVAREGALDLGHLCLRRAGGQIKSDDLGGEQWVQRVDSEH